MSRQLTKSEKLRLIAERLGFKLVTGQSDDKHPLRRTWWRIEIDGGVYSSGSIGEPQWPDFYASEEANALIRYKLAERGRISRMHEMIDDEFYRLKGSHETVSNPERLPKIYRAAVCEAFLKWIEQEKR